MRMEPIGEVSGWMSLLISVVILAMYLLLTRFPMHNFLFEDPITHQYGYDGCNQVRYRGRARRRKK